MVQGQHLCLTSYVFVSQDLSRELSVTGTVSSYLRLLLGFLSVTSVSAGFWRSFYLSYVCVGGSRSFLWNGRLTPLEIRELIMSPLKRSNWFSFLLKEDDMSIIPHLFMPKQCCDLGKLPDSQVDFYMFQTSGDKVQLTDECELWQKMLKNWRGRWVDLAQLYISYIAAFKFSLLLS